MSKSKFYVEGPVKDLLRFTKLDKQREAWIDSGEPVVDSSDIPAGFAQIFHPGPFEAEIVSVKEAPNAKTFRIKALPGYRVPYFRAGQYLSVKFEIDGKSLTRPYGICSSPKEAYEQGFVEITTKRKVGGYTSDYIWEHWQVGTKIRCDGGFGNLFYQTVKDADHVVALAGGTGITPFVSMAKDMLDTGRPKQLTILYGNRREEDILFKEELAALVAKSEGRLRVVHVLSDEEKPGYEQGFITAELVKKVLDTVDGKSYYISGPQAFYKFARTALLDAGVRYSKIHEEANGQSDDILQHPDYPQAMANKIFKLTLRYGVTSVELECNSSETLLVALERQGYANDSRCRSGECGWCRSYMESGDIWYRPESLAVRASDLEDGFVHVCSAYPMSDITLWVQNQL